MAIKVHFDIDGNPVQPRLILATRSGNRIRELPIEQIVFHDTFVSGSEFSFVVNKMNCTDRNGNIDESFWRRITDFKLAYCPEYNMWYEIYVQIDENDETIKTCSATSLGEAELGQINVYGIEVNTEADIARDDYHPTVVYNPNTPSVSLIDRLLYKAPHYRIAHVDESIRNIQRTFTFDSTSVYDAFQTVAKEIDCLFVLECQKTDAVKIDRKISVYDLENNCQVCGERGDFIGVCPNCGSTAIKPGYGDDTAIYVDKDNLAENITYSTDVGSVKNCFRLEAGDDLMTATVINCNPNGSQYIWYITDEMREDMSDALKTRLQEYDDMYDAYQKTNSWTPPEQLRSDYNRIVQKYINGNPELQEIPSPIVGFPALMTAYYNTIDLQLYLNSGLMPNVEMEETTAAEEAAKLISSALTPVAVANLSACTDATATSAVLGMAKCLISTHYQIKAQNASYDTVTHLWSGAFVLTNINDEEDTATSGTVGVVVNEDMETYIRQKLKRAMKQKSDDATDISSLFALDQARFVTELGKYSMQRLLTFRDACQVSLDILIQQGVADGNSWVDAEHNLYNTMYLPYLNKMSAIEEEIRNRTQELAIVAGIYDDNGNLLYPGMQEHIIQRRNAIQQNQNFEAFLGPELWQEFAAYRREDTFSNPNYISDGLNNEELFARAMQFVEVAEKEIYSSAVLQHKLEAEMHNLLAIEEFRPIVHMFKTGNWIRLGVDGKVYRLRLAEYTVKYDDWSLDVEFTDVKFGHNSASDIESLLGMAKSMSTSYGAVARQAEEGKKSADIMQNWVQEGFSLTTKLIGGTDHQEFVIDESGITGREYIPETGEYADEQIRVISHGLYITDDGWLTAKAGIGKFSFFNPQTRQVEEAYGVIANTLVGNLILSQNVGIYNEAGSITLDDDGFTLITESGDGAKVFRIIRREQDGTLTNILSLDAYGNLSLNASSSIGGGATFNDLARKGESIADVDVEYASGTSSTTAPSEGWSTDSPTWESGKYIWQRTKTTSGTGAVSYSPATCIQGARGESGATGKSTAIAYLYKRATSAPSIDWTTTLTYSFTTNSLISTPSGWSATVPSGTDPLYMTAATASSATNTDTIAYTEWATPVMLAMNGSVGRDGMNTATVFLYKRASSEPTKPTAALTYTFATGALTGSLSGWSTTVPTSNGQPCYIIQATAVSADATDTIAASEWSDVSKLVEDGSTGMSTAIAYLYKRAASRPSIDWTTTLTYNFTTKALTSVPSGWSATIPNGTDPIYMTAATASSATETDTIAYTEWASPAMLAMNGSIGRDGASAATVFLYKRSADVPAKPTATLTYTFATGAVTGTLSGWSSSIPDTNGLPCYVIQATAVSAEATDTIAPSEWSAVSKFVEDGEEGVGITSVEEQYYLSTSSTTQTGGEWSTDQPIWASDKYIWVRSKITWDDGEIGYTTPSLASAINGANQTAHDVQTDLDENYSTTDQMNAAIYVGVNGVRTEVVNSMQQMATQFEQTDEQLAMRVATNEDNIGTIQTTFRVTADGAEISKSTSDTVLVMTNDQIEMRVNGDTVTYWNINEQYMPKMVNIPVGGSLRLGSIQFQPRSSGNLSLLWVGDN